MSQSRKRLRLTNWRLACAVSLMPVRSAHWVTHRLMHLLTFWTEIDNGVDKKEAHCTALEELKMGTSLNFQVTGFVGDDPEIRQVNDQSVASFSVAVSRKNKQGNKQTLWVRVNCWGKLSEIASQYVHKGSLVQCSSEWVRPRAWIDQGGNPVASLDMDANRLILLDRVENGNYSGEEGNDDIDF